MEGVRRAGAVLRGLGERIDDLELLDRRARPPVRDDERHRVLVLGANVDEVDVDPVDLGDEVREGREALLERAPVVVRRPVVGQCLDRLELHALGGVHLPVGPLRRVDATAQVVELLLGDVDRERADVRARRGGGLPSWLLSRRWKVVRRVARRPLGRARETPWSASRWPCRVSSPWAARRRPAPALPRSRRGAPSARRRRSPRRSGTAGSCR